MFDLLSVFLAIIIIVIIITIRQNYTRELPGPACRPLIGNLGVFLDIPKIHETFLNLHKQYGNTIELKVFNQKIIVTSDFQIMKEVFLKRDDFIMSTDLFKVLTYFSGPTIIASEGEEWKKRHAKILPLLNHSMIKKNAILVVETALKLAQKIEVGKSINIAPLFHCAGFDIIGSVAFGMELNLVDNPDKKLGNDYLRDIFYIIETGIALRMSLQFMGLEKLWKFPFNAFNKEARAWDNLTKMLKIAIREHENTPIVGDSTNLIYQMLKKTENGHNYSDDEMIADSFAIFMAGQDTSSTILSIFLDILAKNPHIQKRIQQEVDDIYASKPTGWRPSFEDLSEIPYLDNVVKEIFRLYPVAIYASMREVTRDIRINGVNFRKGDKVLLDIYSNHRDPTIFENPEEFNPDRWNSHPNIPLTTFGLGARMCFGKKLATIEIKLMIFILMRHFTFEPDPSKPMRLEVLFVLHPANNQVWLKAKRREHYSFQLE